MIEEAAAAHGEIKNPDVRRKRKAVIENDIAHMFATIPKRAPADVQKSTQRKRTANNEKVIVGKVAKDQNGNV